MSATVLVGDALATLQTLPAQSVQMCVTSPPYFGLRDYGHEGQMGTEETPERYVENMAAVFREVRRVLKDDGTLWLNIGDSYAAQGGGKRAGAYVDKRADGATWQPPRTPPDGLKPKDLIGIPWMLAFALRADGWYLRSDIIWHKPNPMPESVTDRPTKSHEYIFLLSKSERYVYDAAAIKEPSAWGRVNNPDWAKQRADTNAKKGAGNRNAASGGFTKWDSKQGRNKRSVWTVTTRPFKGAHFATFPPDLIEPCIMAGSKIGDTVLDPFGGAGTTALVADRLGRDSLLIELNPDYATMARDRVSADNPLCITG